MKRLLLTVAAFAFSTGLAFAADSMSAFYGNTLQIKTAEGTTKIWYKADKTYSGVDAKGAKFSGSWEATGDQLCATQKDPAPPAGQEKQCHPMVPHKVGDSWEHSSPDGRKASLSLVAGS